MAKIESGKVGVIAYTVHDSEGTFVHRMSKDSPQHYLHGHGNLPAGLERELDGLEVGATRSVEVSPADGFGERTGEPQAVPKREFPRNIKLEAGMPLRMEGSDGEEVIVWVHEVRGSRVLLHTDHPLAGKTLRYEVEVLDVRDPTAEELSHGHAHGPGGHHH